MPVVFREDLLPRGVQAAAVTAAFDSVGAARILVPGAEEEGGALERAAGIAGRLATSIGRRVAVRRWVAAYGGSPDDLVSRRALGPSAAALEEALADVSCDEAALVLAGLASPAVTLPRAGPALVPLLLERLLGLLPGSALPCIIGLGVPERSVAAALLALGRSGGPPGGCWIADASLAVSLLLEGERLSFKAHHPVIQDELRDWCRRHGIDLA